MRKHYIEEMNENGPKLVVFCEADELVIGGSLFPHKTSTKQHGNHQKEKTNNQIDHIMIIQKFTTGR